MKTEKENEKHECEVCGARVRDWGRTTCDGTCLRAKDTGRTRGQQFSFEMKREAERAALEAWATEPEIGYHGGNLELSNRPYLAEAFA